MSWSESFPILTDEMVGEYAGGASSQEKTGYDRMFSVARKFNLSQAGHIVAFSLFWKHANDEDGDLPALTREILENADDRGLVKRFAPWEHYVRPLLEGAKAMRARRSDVVFRVYLAADLDFLIEELVDAGCEVFLMRSSSIRHNPGAMWRFLALSEPDRRVTISDADRAGYVDADIERTELISKMGLGFWRVPVWGDFTPAGMTSYRPILGCQFGSVRSLDVRPLMKALVWHTERGSISASFATGGCDTIRIYGGKWPDYGFDEWFLLAAVYPRVAKRGLLTFVPATAKSRILPLDIEYAVWSNPRSELVYFGTGDFGCCPLTPGAGTRTGTFFTKIPKWLNWHPLSMASGIGDRLRGIATMAAVARFRGETLRVLWIKSAYCPEKLTNLFYPGGLAVIEDETEWVNATHGQTVHSLIPYWIPPRDAWESPLMANIENNDSNQKLFNQIRSAYLRGFAPLPFIADELNRTLQQWAGTNVLGIHVRRTDAYAIQGQKTEDLDLPLEHYIERMGRDGWNCAFVCSDDLATEERWVEWLRIQGWEAVQSDKTWHRRQLRQTAAGDACLDLMLLSRCTKIVASIPSNFSGVAADMGGIEIDIAWNEQPTGV